jgi:hypothetical protein
MAEYDDPMLMDALGSPMIPDPNSVESMIEAYKRLQRFNKGSEQEAKPVTQTIKTDPKTGEQTMTVSGSVEDLGPGNPLAPTVVPAMQNRSMPAERPIPVAPQAYNDFTRQMESGANPNIGYHNPAKSSAYGAYGITAPQYQEIQKSNPAFAGRDITTLTPEEQGAANMTSRDVYARQLAAKGVEPTEENIRMAHLLGAGGANQYLKSGTFNPEAVAANGGEEQLRRMVEQRRAGPVAPQAPGMQPSPMIAGTASSDVGLTPTEQAIAQMTRNPAAPVEQWQVDLTRSQNNPTRLYAMAGNESLPEEIRNAARDQAIKIDTNAREKQRAAETIRIASDPTDPGHIKASNEMLKAQRDKSDNGSWIKAILLQGAGFTRAADRELQKLEGGEFGQVSLGGQSYSVQKMPDGSIKAAWDRTGKAVDDAKLAQINAESTTAGTAQYAFTGEPGVVNINGQMAEVRQRTNNRTGAIENVIVSGPLQGQIYKGAEMPIAKSVGTSNLKEQGRQQIQGDWVGPNANNKAAGTFAGEFNARTGAQIGIREIRPGENEYFDKYTGMPVINSNGQFNVVTRPTVPNAAPAPGQTQTQAVPQGPVRPVAPGQTATQPAPAATTGPTPGVSPTPGIPGSTPLRPFNPAQESPDQYNAYKQSWQKEQDELSQEVAKIKLSLPKINSNADAVIKTVDDVLKHPGFTDVVGFPNILTGIYSPPGTDARNAKAKIKELEGKQFLQAFESLKGGGSITEKEGSAATAAISALQDPGISEDEYRRNATIFKNSVRRMVNRQLEMAGQPPKFKNTQMEIEDSKKVDGVTYVYDGIGWKKK